MKNPVLITATLSISGLIAIGVGLGILALPHAFHASAGIALGDDVNLLNEIRASGGMVLLCGVFAMLGAIRDDLAIPALMTTGALYLCYGLSRVVSVAVDGIPGPAVLQITALELCIGVACLLLLNTQRSPAPEIA